MAKPMPKGLMEAEEPEEEEAPAEEMEQTEEAPAGGGSTDEPAEAPESDPALEEEAGVKGAGPTSNAEKQAIKTSMDAIATLLYKNKRVGKAVADMIRQPPHFEAIADAVMLLIRHVREQGVYIPDHLIAGIAIKTMELVMDLGLSLGFLPQDKELVRMAFEKTLRAVGDDYGIDPAVMKASRKTVAPGQGLLE